MGLDYAAVHAKYTIPPAILLTLLYRPLFSKREAYRVAFLVTIAVISTIPWDSYLIRRHIWTYPAHAVLGPTVFHIPLEELFFFFIQTYDVSLFYLIYSKATFYPAHLRRPDSQLDKSALSSRTHLPGIAGQIALFLSIVQGALLVQRGEQGTYLGLIVVWASPFLLLLWSLSFDFMLRVPKYNIFVPILLPTLYLWIVDTFSLQRGTWVIEHGTKYGIHLWDGLEMEEALFFLATNALIVFGQLAFDNAIAILDTFQDVFPEHQECPSIVRAVQALMMPIQKYDGPRLVALNEAVNRLQKKSRSFFLASAMFQGRLRIDLILLYSFCRVADDLVDNAGSIKEARHWIDHLRKYLDLAYAQRRTAAIDSNVQDYVNANFREEARNALLQLPVASLSKDPLYDLLKGFEMDLLYTAEAGQQWPINDDRALETYGKYVAGTVAELCCDLLFHHHGGRVSVDKRRRLKDSARKMGIALQTVNISRDIGVDAAMGRVYIPTEWLEEVGLQPPDVLKDPAQAKILHLRSRLLRKAFSLYSDSRPAIEELPAEARAGMRVAIESYMEIGRVLKDEQYQLRDGRATVPARRRLRVAWQALNS